MQLNNISGAWVIEGFRRGGVDIKKLTQHYPEDINMLTFNMYTIPPDNINRLLMACSEMSGDKHFGLTMNERLDVTMYGLIGYIMLNSSTGYDLCKNIAHYYSIFYSAGPAFKFLVHKDNIEFLFVTNHPENISHHHQVEWSLGAVPYFLFSSLGEAAKPLSASFIHDAPDNLDKLESIFGYNLKFNQFENKLVYSKSILNKKINNADTGLLEILIEEANQKLNNYIKSESLLEKIKLILIERINGENCNASDIARELNFTLSTFKRKMIKDNINFRKTKESVKNELAKKLLTNTTAKINDIARKTGFSDQSSFTRFFIRCNKQTPQTFRERYFK